MKLEIKDRYPTGVTRTTRARRSKHLFPLKLRWPVAPTLVEPPVKMRVCTYIYNLNSCVCRFKKKNTSKA